MKVAVFVYERGKISIFSNIPRGIKNLLQWIASRNYSPYYDRQKRPAGGAVH